MAGATAAAVQRDRVGAMEAGGDNPRARNRPVPKDRPADRRGVGGEAILAGRAPHKASIAMKKSGANDKIAAPRWYASLIDCSQSLLAKNGGDSETWRRPRVTEHRASFRPVG